MIFFLDENFPKTSGYLLQAKGHQVIDIRGSKNEGADDTTIFSMAQKHSAIFLTTDKDFFHTVPHLYPVHFGIIVVNLRQPNRLNIAEKMEWVLKNIDLANFKSRVLLLHDTSYILSKDT